MDFSDYSCLLRNLSGCELVALAGLIAVSIAQNLSLEDINILGNFFSAIGSNLSTIANAGEIDK